MQLLKFGVVFGLIALVVAGHHDDHDGSSYASLVKHEEPHQHYEHHEIEHDNSNSQHDHDDHNDYHSHPNYKFEYGVEDSHTGDNKNQWEHRDGDQVKGSYEFYEADGTKRVVEYHADKHGGFNAVVKRIGHAHHPQVYGHHESHKHGHDQGHSHGHAESWANSNLYDHHH